MLFATSFTNTAKLFIDLRSRFDATSTWTPVIGTLPHLCGFPNNTFVRVKDRMRHEKDVRQCGNWQIPHPLPLERAHP